MPVTRRALLTGVAAVTVAGCHGRPSADRSAPPHLSAADVAAAAAAATAEAALLDAVDTAVSAGGPGAARWAATRADHAAHLAALTASAGVEAATPPPSAGEPVALERAGLAALSAAAVGATSAGVVTVLAAVAAAHRADLTTTTPIVVPASGGAVGDGDEPSTGTAQSARTASALASALAAEHQAVYGYGLVGARLVGRPRRLALVALDAHETRRDEIAALISSTGRTPAAAAPAYVAPFPISRPIDALRLAARLESSVAGSAWDLAAAAGAGSAARRLAVAALTDAAARGSQWRALGHLPRLLPLPGRPGQPL